MGLGWMFGMVIIGHRSSKSTFGAKNCPKELARKLIKYAKLNGTRVKYANPDFEENAKNLNV